jgi:hypothetical protein
MGVTDAGAPLVMWVNRFECCSHQSTTRPRSAGEARDEFGFSMETRRVRLRGVNRWHWFLARLYGRRIQLSSERVRIDTASPTCPVSNAACRHANCC